MQADVFNIYDHHHDIADIKKHAVSWMFRRESLAEQVRIQILMQSMLPGLKDRLLWDRNAIDAWKVRQLGILVDWAFQTVPFYRDVYGKSGYQMGAIRSLQDFATLPCLSRSQIIGNFPEQIISSQFNKDTCRWLSSSGSSGQPVQLVMQQDRTEMDTLHRVRMFEQMNGQSLPRDKWIYNINHAVWWHTSFNGDSPVFSVNQKCPLEAVLLHLSKLRPCFLSSITSYVELMASAGVNLAKYGIKTVATNSETSSAKQRRQWGKALGVTICDEYSSEEAGLLAHECPYGYYHLIEDDTHLEVIETDQSGLGRVIVTDLWNVAMPIIRYDQGDYSSFENSALACPCGNHFRRINAVAGRIDEAFESRNGKILPGILLEATENYLSHDDSGLAEYRVTQLELDLVEVSFVLNKGFQTPSVAIVEQFRIVLAELFGHNVQLQLKEVVQIADVSRNKRKVLINSLGRVSA